jgi:hypothetical protein
MKLTRRKLAATVLGTAAGALSQTQPAPSTPEDELKAARDRVRANAETIARHDVPMATEPAFQFKA